MKTITSLFLALFVLCGCSSELDNIETPIDPDAPVAIRPTTLIHPLGDEATRAGGVIKPGSAISASFFRADETYAANWAAVASALPASIAANGTVTFGTTQYYNNAQTSKLVGIYPAIGSGATWAPATGTGTVTATIDGYTDIMATPIVSGSRSGQPSLTFAHLLTQIQVAVIGEDATAIGLWGTVNSVSVTGRTPTCTIVLPIPTAASGTAIATPTFSGATTALPVRTEAGATPSALTVTTSEQTFGHCMFAPVTSTAVLPLSVVTSKGGTVTVNVPTQTYLAGTSYKIVLKLTKSAISATATIAAWTTGEGKTVEL